METKPESEELPEIHSVISRDIVVEGDIEAREAIRIEGTVKGSVHSTGEVRVENTAVVEAGIRAERIVIRGKVTGDVEAVGRLVIDGDGKLYGNCVASSIRIDEGAVFEGRSELRKK